MKSSSDLKVHWKRISLWIGDDGDGEIEPNAEQRAQSIFNSIRSSAGESFNFKANPANLQDFLESAYRGPADCE